MYRPFYSFSFHPPIRFKRRYNRREYDFKTRIGSSMLNKVVRFIKKHQLLSKNSRILLGVSGGPDSIALLHLLNQLKDDWNLELIVLTVDHQLRGEESKEDVSYVKKICKSFGIEVIHTSVDVRTYQQRNKVSTQVAARKLRYSFFKEQMNKRKADYLALGHHGDDQVETMLMALVRNTNPKALSGIPVKRPIAAGMLIRPLLCVTKEEIIQYCKENELAYRTDPSNENIDYTRSYFRKQIVPLIKEKNDNIHITMQRLSEALKQDDEYLHKKAREIVHSVVTFSHKNRYASFKIQDFKKHSLSLQRRSYHLILNYLYHPLPQNLSYTHEDIFFDVMNSSGNVQVDFPGELKVKKQYDQMILSFQSEEKSVEPFEKIISIPGKTTFLNGEFVAAYLDQFHRGDQHTFVFNVENVILPLKIRTRQKGDRMSWKGLGGHKKIKDIFIDEKIPRKKRDQWPIVTDHEGNILWLVGLRKANIDLHSNHPIYIELSYRKRT